MNKRTPHVLKVENGIPNPDDALEFLRGHRGTLSVRLATSLP